jgi:hypothetical protein
MVVGGELTDSGTEGTVGGELTDSGTEGTVGGELTDSGTEGTGETDWRNYEYKQIFS